MRLTSCCEWEISSSTIQVHYHRIGATPPLNGKENQSIQVSNHSTSLQCTSSFQQESSEIHGFISSNQRNHENGSHRVPNGTPCNETYRAMQLHICWFQICFLMPNGTKMYQSFDRSKDRATLLLLRPQWRQKQAMHHTWYLQHKPSSQESQLVLLSQLRF